jgi:hypothetical protein
MPSSWMLRRVALLRTDVSEEHRLFSGMLRRMALIGIDVSEGRWLSSWKLRLMTIVRKSKSLYNTTFLQMDLFTPSGEAREHILCLDV